MCLQGKWCTDQGSCHREMLEVGYHIVEKSRGLPLALILIDRGWSGKKKGRNFQLKIQHNLDSIISVNNNLQMTKVMQLSYDHLPFHMKSLCLTL